MLGGVRMKDKTCLNCLYEPKWKERVGFCGYDIPCNIPSGYNCILNAISKDTPYNICPCWKMKDKGFIKERKYQPAPTTINDHGEE